MKRLLASSAALLLCFTLLSSQCTDSIDDFVPDINTDISQEYDVANATNIAVGEISIDPNSNADFRDNADKLKLVTVTQVRFTVIKNSYSKNRLVKVAEVFFKHPDSTNYLSLGKVTNLTLSQMETPVAMPATAAALNTLGNLALTSNKGIKLKYSFEADSAGITFRGKSTLNVTLKVNP